MRKAVEGRAVVVPCRCGGWLKNQTAAIERGRPLRVIILEQIGEVVEGVCSIGIQAGGSVRKL